MLDVHGHVLAPAPAPAPVLMYEPLSFSAFCLFSCSGPWGLQVKCSFLEIYNEEMEDLLSEKTHMKKGGKEATAAKMRLIDHETRGAICHGLLEQPVT
jgi:hypothetical protein